MDAEQVRALARKLPHVEETMQWGENLVFWVGDKALGGKMFAMLSLEAGGGHSGVVLSLSAGPERYQELLEVEGIIPAPYMARIFWVGLQRLDVLGNKELRILLEAAHALTYAKLPARTRALLVLPMSEQRRLIAERRKAAAEKAKP